MRLIKYPSFSFALEYKHKESRTHSYLARIATGWIGQYEGWLSMNQYPYREDAAGALIESILWLAKYRQICSQHQKEISKLIVDGDPVAMFRFLRKVVG